MNVDETLEQSGPTSVLRGFEDGPSGPRLAFQFVEKFGGVFSVPGRARAILTAYLECPDFSP